MTRTPWLASFLIVGACSTSTVGSMRARAADDWNCPESSINVSNEGQSVYRVSGCGRSALYECSANSDAAGSVPQTDAEDYRFQGVGDGCFKVSKD